MKYLSKNIIIRFYSSLNDFLSPENKQIPFEYGFSGTPAIVDVIESLGVPHCEVHKVLINSKEANLSKNIYGGEYVSVFPASDFEIGEQHQKFILDVHLGKLCKKLRLLGFDVYYENDLDDDEIINISIEQNRIILTRDIGLLKNGKVKNGCFVRNTNSDKQLEEILSRYKLKNFINPFTRCITCNGKFVKINKEVILERLEPKTKEFYDEFFECNKCGKIFWEGSHFENMKKYLDGLK